MIRSIIAASIINLFCIFTLAAGELAENAWLSERFGRLSPHPGYWIMDVRAVEQFQPSGVGLQVYTVGEYAILHNHGLYWSNEENRDSSKDMHASVIIFHNGQRVFVARGYNYSKFQTDPIGETFSFQHWTGTMGHEQLTVFQFRIRSEGLSVTTKKKSTKDP